MCRAQRPQHIKFQTGLTKTKLYSLKLPIVYVSDKPLLFDLHTFIISFIISFEGVYYGGIT